MNYVPETPFTSPSFNKFLKNAKKDEFSKILAFQIGAVLIFLFLALAILAPQIGRKLGYLSVKKQAQLARADIGGLVLQINNYRKSQNPPLASLTEDQYLINTACWMANDMAQNNYFSHTDSLGRDAGTRLHDFGIGNEWLGENAAKNTADPNTVLKYWKESPGHNAILLEDKYKRIGVGKAAAANGDIYWVADFSSGIPVSVTDLKCNDPLPSPIAEPTPVLASPLPIIDPSPSPLPTADIDQDGFTDLIETSIGTDPQDACGNPVDNSLPGSPSKAWPADLFTREGPLKSFKKITIEDITSFLAPIRRLDTKSGDTNYHIRWDLNTDGFINISDIQIVVALHGKTCAE